MRTQSQALYMTTQSKGNRRDGGTESWIASMPPHQLPLFGWHPIVKAPAHKFYRGNMTAPCPSGAAAWQNSYTNFTGGWYKRDKLTKLPCARGLEI